MKAGMVTGTVFVIDSKGGRSPVNGANVQLSGNSFSTGTVTDETGKYSFPSVAPAAYQSEVKSPGLAGSKTVTVVSGATVDAPIQLEVEAIRESVTVSGGDNIRKGSRGECFGSLPDLVYDSVINCVEPKIAGNC